MANARFVLGTTGGQMEISESTGVTGTTGYGTLYASSVDSKLHYVDGSGNDIPLQTAAVVAEGNCNLVSTGVGGASTGATGAVVLGCAANNGVGDYSILIGSNSLNGHGGCNHVIIGKGANTDANNDTACDHVIIGSAARTFCKSAAGRGCNVVIGTNACTIFDGGQIAIGAYACAQSSVTYLTTRIGLAVGLCAKAIGNATHAIGALSTACGSCAIAIGSQASSTSNCAIALGGLAQATNTGSVALGYGISTSRDNTTHVENLYVTGGETVLAEIAGATGATGFGILYVSSVDNKLHFSDSSGNDAPVGGGSGELQTTGTCTLYTPNVGATITGTGDSNIVIGCGANTCSNGGVFIGENARNTGGCNLAKASEAPVAIGYNALVGSRSAIAIGHNAAATNDVSIAIGKSANSNYQAIAIGAGACQAGSWGMAIGRSACNLSANGAFTVGKGTTIIGDASYALSGIERGSLLGNGARLCASCTQVLGNLSCADHVGASVIGYCLTSERDNTLHTTSLISYGQGVSKGHDVGPTGGTVTIDWDNSNTQKIEITADITSLTLSNPIQGGVYSLIVEQRNAAGNTITWPAGSIKWPGGTPPTLTSGATGDTDIISLVYDPAGGTGYYGNANLAFS